MIGRDFVDRENYPDAFDLSDTEYRDFISQELVFATHQRVLIMHYNMRESLLKMDREVDEIIAHLGRIIDEY